MDITKNIASSIEKIKKYKAGGSVKDYIRKYNIDKDKLIRLASNENVYGPTPLIEEKIKAIASKLSLYPGTDYSELKDAFSNYAKVNKENITLGNGSDELFLLISLIFGKDKSIIIPQPTFTWYRTTALLANSEIKNLEIKESNDFRLKSDDIIKNVDEPTSLIFLATPNNPTGYRMPYSDIEKVVSECESQCIVIDEAYFDFCNDKSAMDLIDYGNVIVTRTMSKAFGLAGVRVGFGAASKEIIDVMEKVKPPFNINSVGLQAAITALEDRSYHEATVDAIKKERENLYSKCKEIEGIKVYKSDANFLFMKVEADGFDSEKLFVELLKMGILVRNCSSFENCDNNFIRTTVGTPDQNERFITSLKEILGD